MPPVPLKSLLPLPQFRLPMPLVLGWYMVTAAGTSALRCGRAPGGYTDANAYAAAAAANAPLLPLESLQ